MAVDFSTVADRIFDQLKGFGYQIAIFDVGGKQTQNAKEGRRFYSMDQKFTVELSEKENVIKIKFGESTDKNKLKELQRTIKGGIAKKYLIGVDVMPYSGTDIELKHAENVVSESLGPSMGSVKTSYQQTEGAKLIIRHNKPVNEEVRGSRSRNISALFIENAQGERFKYPHTHLAGARIMTQHVAEGGTPYDEVGQKIIGLSEERTQLMRVTQYIRSNGLQEQAGDIGSVVQMRLSEIKQILGRYNAESLMNDVHESDDTDVASLKERLTKNVFDESIGEMLPKLNGYMKSYQSKLQAESAMAELKQEVEESVHIYFSEMPDVDMSEMIVYESPTINTTELINMVLPVLEDESVKQKLTAVATHVQEGLLDPALVDNITRSIVGKAALAEKVSDILDTNKFFESAISKFSIREILK
jgi:hypothetical protein